MPAFLASFVSLSHAADIVWDGGSRFTTEEWADSVLGFFPSDNWNRNRNPAPDDNLFFAGTRKLANNNNTTADTRYGGITFNNGAGSFVLSGNRVILNAAGITNNSTNLQTINLPITVEGNQTLNAASGSIRLDGVINGSGGITKIGTQSVTLAGANTYTGNTNVNGGSLVVSNASAVAGSGNVSIHSGATLTSTVANFNAKALTLAGGNLNLNGTSSGTVTLAANSSFSMTGGIWSLNLASNTDQIKGSGSGTFSISGGTLDLGGGAINYASTYNLLSGFASGSVADLTFTNFDSFHFAPSLSNSGVLSFSEVPEPASAIAGVAVLAGMLRRRRAATA